MLSSPLQDKTDYTVGNQNPRFCEIVIDCLSSRSGFGHERSRLGLAVGRSLVRSRGRLRVSLRVW